MRTAAARTRRSRRRFLPAPCADLIANSRASAGACAPRRCCSFAARFERDGRAVCAGRVRRCVDRVVASSATVEGADRRRRLRRVQPTRRAVRAGQDDTRRRSAGCAPGLQFRARCCGHDGRQPTYRFVLGRPPRRGRRCAATDDGRARRQSAGRVGAAGFRSDSTRPPGPDRSAAGDEVRGRPRAARPHRCQGRRHASCNRIPAPAACAASAVATRRACDRPSTRRRLDGPMKTLPAALAGLALFAASAPHAQTAAAAEPTPGAGRGGEPDVQHSVLQDEARASTSCACAARRSASPCSRVAGELRDRSGRRRARPGDRPDDAARHDRRARLAGAAVLDAPGRRDGLARAPRARGATSGSAR